MLDLPPGPKLPERLLRNARVLRDRYAILPLLPKQKTFVEVGAALGGFSSHVLSVCQPKHFIAIDLFNLHLYPGSIWGREPKDVFGDRTHYQFYRELFSDAIEQNIVTMLQGDSAASLEELEDASIDIVYVDADHQYTSVKRELNIIRRKIKDNGYIILNDYIMNEAGASNSPYGVIQATNEFMIAENWEMLYFAFHEYMYCDVVLRKVGGQMSNEHPDANDRQIAELQAANASLAEALATMHASRSWRITAPIRALTQLLKHRSLHGTSSTS